MDSIKDEIRAELARTKISKTDLYNLLMKMCDHVGTGGGAKDGARGPPGPAGPAGPPGRDGTCQCKCPAAAAPAAAAPKKTAAKKSSTAKKTAAEE